MEKSGRIVKYSLPRWGIALAMFTILGWVLILAWGPSLFFLTGEGIRFICSDLFSGYFNYQFHTGWALDQPTIGKFIIWFIFMLVTSLPLSAFVLFLVNPSDRTGGLIFAVLFSIQCLLLACILGIAFLLLLQYVYAMGITAKRGMGLAFCGMSFSVLVVIAVSVFFVTGSPSRSKFARGLLVRGMRRGLD